MAFLKAIWNTWWSKWTWPLKLASGIVLIIVLALVVGWFKSCGKKTPKLDEPAIHAAQVAIAADDHKAMVEVLVQSDVKEKQINENLANAKADTVNAIADSKKTWEAKTNQELADEINKRAQ